MAFLWKNVYAIASAKNWQGEGPAIQPSRVFPWTEKVKQDSASLASLNILEPPKYF